MACIKVPFGMLSEDGQNQTKFCTIDLDLEVKIMRYGKEIPNHKGKYYYEIMFLINTMSNVRPIHYKQVAAEVANMNNGRWHTEREIQIATLSSLISFCTLLMLVIACFISTFLHSGNVVDCGLVC